jgi:N-acetyl-anhydromuramyl-L-alanine amidase AmpD
MIEIKNYIDLLPWHPTRRWQQRSLSKVKYIIVHQSLCDSTVQNINNYHITPSENNHISTNGAPHICYHYIIGKDSLYKTNSLTDVTWHCRGHNTDSIGICLLGNFDGPSYQGTNTPTDFQVVALAELLERLYKYQPDFKKLNIKKSLKGHCDFFGKENCPGIYFQGFIKEYRNK